MRALFNIMIAGIAVAGAPATAGSRAAPATAITGATIFDGTGREPFRGTVLLRNGRIEAVGPDVKIPRGASIVRADGKALLPGFFDVHTHWSPTGTPATVPQIATAYVESGVTTVNDFHQQPESFAPRRAWLGELVSPHVNFVARMSTPGGHGADWGDINTTRWVATAESARRAVAALQPYQPDYIKVFADGWRYGALPDETSMNAETLGAIATEAHKHGQRVLSHTVTVDRGRLAAIAGVDVIAHSLQDRPLDADSIALIRRAGTFYAPTLAIYEPRPEDAAAAEKGDAAARQRLRKWGYALQNVRALHDAGVTIATGTDAGIGGARHGTSTLHEMELLVAAGLAPRAALLAGTANSALALGLLADRGTIEKGKRADIVLTDGRPWENIADVRRIDRVYIDGRLAHGGNATLPAANLARALPPSPAAEGIDDFERADGRTSLDTLRLAEMDFGVERSTVITNRVPRADGGTALALATTMSLKEKPHGGILVPLSRGSVRPVDARAFQGVALDLRGAGRYRLVVVTLAGEWVAEVEGEAGWRTLRIPFTALVPTRPGRDATAWRGDDLLQVGLIARREAGESAWAELDNLRFYR